MQATDDQKELARVEAVRSLGLLDTPAEERFDRYTRLARRVFGVPIALISLIDDQRQWFKSRQGIEQPELPRNHSFCNITISEKEVVVISDARKDPRAEGNPLVTGKRGIRFYAGIPILTSQGVALGTFCIADHRPRKLKEADLDLLKDLAELVQEEIVVQNLATIDDLTGLSNRRGFLAISSHAIAMCRRMGKPATLMFFDLDGFKSVNDVYVHAEGDKVLVDVARILLDLYRNSDVIARLGGDEFCVLLTGTAADSIERPLQNLDRVIQKENEGHPYTIGYSVGTVSFVPDRHPGIEELLEEADQLMYEQKRDKSSDR